MLKSPIYLSSSGKPKIVTTAPVSALKEYLLTPYTGNVTFKSTGSNRSNSFELLSALFVYQDCNKMVKLSNLLIHCSNKSWIGFLIFENHIKLVLFFKKSLNISYLHIIILTPSKSVSSNKWFYMEWGLGFFWGEWELKLKATNCASNRQSLKFWVFRRKTVPLWFPELKQRQ